LSALALNPAYELRSNLRHQFRHASIRQPALRAVLPDLLHQRRLGYRVEHGIARAGVDVPPPQEVRRDEHVVALPVEALAGDLGRAAALDADVERARRLALPARLFAGPQQLRPVGEGGENRRAIDRIDESEGDALVRIALFLRQRAQ